MNMRRIGDLTKPVSSWNPQSSRDGAEFTYVDLGSVDQDLKTIIGPRRIPTADAPSRARQIIREGDVLVSTVRPNLNGVARVSEKFNEATASTGFSVLRPTGQLDSGYLFHWVRSPEFVADMSRKATGQSYPAVSDRIVKDSQIPVPPVSEQQRIASVLDEVDSLRATRREAIALLDDIRWSVFYEMFGEVASNDRGWIDGAELCRVAEIRSGITKGRKSSGECMRPVSYMAVSNVQAGYLDLSTVKEIEATEEEIDRYRLVENDLLLTEGGDPDKLGRGTLWKKEIPECIHQNHVFCVRLVNKSTVAPVFLSWLVASSRGKRYFARSAKQTTGIASINMSQLKKFPLLLPPISLQEEFSSRIEQIDRCLASYLAHLAELDALFASLRHRAFRGELWTEEITPVA